MNLDQLKQILSTASELTGESEFYIIGSSAIMAVFDSPADFYLSRSNEADILALSGNPDVADQISILIGELSPFHENHDVYAEGCTFDTPVFAPDGWRDRSIPVTYDDIEVTAHFMELHDLVLSKIGAGRPKDIEFCSALFKTQYLNRDTLIERLPFIACSSDQKQVIENRINRYFH